MTKESASTREKLAAHGVGRGSEPRDKEGGFFVSKDVEDEKPLHTEWAGVGRRVIRFFVISQEVNNEKTPSV